MLTSAQVSLHPSSLATASPACCRSPLERLRHIALGEDSHSRARHHRYDLRSVHVHCIFIGGFEI